MENLPQSPGNTPKNIWDSNPKLKYLLKVFFICLFASVMSLVVLKEVANYFRTKNYERTETLLAARTPKQDLITYKNGEYGFELQYSEKYYALDDLQHFTPDPNNKLVVSLYNLVSKQESQKCDCGEVARFQVRVSKSTFSSIEDFINQRFSANELQYSNPVTTTVSGIPAVTVGERDRSTYLIYKGNLYEISKDEAILKTFKFVNADDGWKTYRSEEYGFEFKYPNEWKFNEAVLSSDVDVDDKMVNVSSPSDYSSRISILPTGGFDHGWPSSTPKQEKIKFAGEDANKIYWDEKLYESIAFPNPKPNWNKYNRIEISFGKDGKDKELIEKILSTFKFASVESKWETYKNDEYGFELEYPANWFVKERKEGNNLIVDFNPEASESFALLSLRIVNDKRSLKDYVNNSCYGECSDIFYKAKSIKVSGLDGVRLEPPSLVKIDGAYWKKDDYIYYTQIILDDSYGDKFSIQQKIDILSELLTSFKLTNN